ncbi:Smr protein/MutS2 C-terminal [Cinnamomum micranthum f. kanehirae]|uniref:Smr protein/MutS2 C-terminal n=1 Tax=Cinnamomum micranthum f. kanehirae TaxID=337451 RepID=A0A3S3Q4P0_9MAGN|nr:Smr protein/MutS2 C-terminal [Cinnamomum micranthum f. kanehirae]
MTTSSSPLHLKMSQTRHRSSGWAAFDLKHGQKQCSKPELNADPFPPILETTSAGVAGNLARNHCQLTRPFSSVVQPSSDFQVLTSGSKIGMPVNNSNRKMNNQITEESSMTPILAKLRQLHSWADDSLVEDILTTVNNDQEKASALLKAMVSSGSEDSKKKVQELSPVFENHLCNEKTELMNEADSLENQPSDCTAAVKFVPGHLFSIPIEPEWEEDDVYFRHRKEAIKIMRSSSQHSSAASNAFLKGDHFAAKQLSLKARGERLAAEKLNAKAAKKILLIRNGKNDVWKLDLHGLHASEAICALEEHLHRIETQMLMKRSVSSDGLNTPQVGIVHSPSVECTSSALYMEAKTGKQQALSTPRQTILQVITGTGNHSRGQAALPTAVRSFLIEKGYRFEDARPGVFAVRPKFRNGSCPQS